jgi:hypothetical protein
VIAKSLRNRESPEGSSVVQEFMKASVKIYAEAETPPSSCPTSRR